MSGHPERLERMAQAAIRALVGAPVSWADVPEKTREIMRRLALAVHEADSIKLEAN